VISAGRRRPSDEGAVLVIVLVVVTVVAVVVAAVVSQTEIGVRGSVVVRDHLSKIYAADAGVEHAIQSLKRDNTICPDPAHDHDFPTQTFNGYDVEVTCDTISGSANGLFGYAVVVLDPADSLTTQGGVGVPKQIDGPVYAVRLPSSFVAPLTVTGDVHEQEGRCTSDSDVPASMTISVGYSFDCVPAGAAPHPERDLPASEPPNAPAPDMTTVPGCKIFKPGTYTTAPALAPNNYFASGVYYFENVGQIVVDNEKVVGGKAGAGELSVNGNVPCATDALAGVTNAGSGVRFIFGGNTSLLVDDPSGAVELFSRDDPDEPTDEGAEGISFQTVRADQVTASPPQWMASTLGAGDPVIRVGSGTNPALSIHGMVYAPNALVDFSATNTSQAQLRGGVVAARLKLQSSASASGLAVSVNTGVGRRHIVVTSKAKGVTSGDRDVLATAVLDIVSDTLRTVSIESWNTS
jgi:hypothetical protein